MPSGSGPAPPGSSAPTVYRLGWLANALTVLFSITALLLVINIFVPHRISVRPVTEIYVNVRGFPALLAGVIALATVVLFLNWFYRARKNAALTGWRQRRSPGWAIGSWFLPPVFAWFPFQIMADIWRAGRPADQRARAASAALPGLWWALWLLAWITSFQHETTQVTHGPTTDITSIYALNFGGTTLSAVFAAAAAIVLIMIIRTVSAGPVGLPAHTQCATPDSRDSAPG